MLRIAIILPGLGRVQRGAETAFLEISRALAQQPGVEVDLFGSGERVPSETRSIVIPCRPREKFERWRKLPALRSECHYEELSFVWGLLRSRRFRPERYDATISCTYPYVNWLLRGTRRRGRPKLIFVTQNGDWMCRAGNAEYRFFHCDGLVCVNPTYWERNRANWPCALIPNGVDPTVYHPDTDAAAWHDDRVPSGAKVVLMASALIPSKGVDLGVEAVARVPDAFLVVAGDGPERGRIADLAAAKLPERHLLLGSADRSLMPSIYRRASAFLHMSQDEPFGIVYLEAAASGLPIVAPDNETSRWILGDAALWMRPDDPKSAAGAIAAALDPERGRELGRAARARMLDGWTWEAQGRKYREFIETTARVSTRSAATPKSDQSLAFG